MSLLANPGTLAFALFFLFLLVNFPVSISLGLATLITIVIHDIVPLTIIPYQFSGAIDSFPLLAIPLFILAGNMLGRTGIASRLVNLASAFFGDLPGGLAITTIVAGAMLGAMSGSNAAAIAALSFLIGAMAQAGYPRKFGVAVVAAGCTFGVVIPPSINLIVYGVLTSTSIPKLFAAGVLPGILLAVVLSSYVYFVSHREGYRGVKVERTWKSLGTAFKEAFWGLLAPIIILGGIYGGIFTATEAAAVAVAYVFLIDRLVYRQIKLSDYPQLLWESGLTTGVVMLIIGTAAVFSWILMTQGMASAVTNALMAVSGGNKIVLLLLINLVFIVAGAFIDPVSAIYLLVPLFFPAVTAAGVDPIHFGAIMTVNLSMAHLTPPVGIGLYLASQVGKVPFAEAARSALPFVACETAVIFIVTFVPWLSLYLPSLIS